MDKSWHLNGKDFLQLRDKAKGLLAHMNETDAVGDDPTLSQLYEELMTFHIELDLQNDELKQTRLDAELRGHEVAQFFDFAPFAYFKVDRRSFITRWNLAGAELFGCDRIDLDPRRHTLIGLVAVSDHYLLASHLRKVSDCTCIIRQNLMLRSGELVSLHSRRVDDYILVAVVPLRY